MRLGDITTGIAAYRQAWTTVEGIIEELPAELASGYLDTPDLVELVSEIESLPQL